MINYNNYNVIAAIQPNTNNGMLKCKKVGTTESQIWSCLPSAFKPDVGPRVESEAGEPASPSAAATPTIDIVASGEKLKATHKGT